ncbi:uncharacterized protein Gcw-chp [Acinetobacter calcoaceticus]|uniref:Uncharacterized protein Gcw-chp n=1 Tax=Acinetobacter calcoaceticus TaxID=471 RepID=A0A4V2R256_ACICA|nr:uncharacterized protein Gcw-chp [Acinetobacter calcoaceticus]
MNKLAVILGACAACSSMFALAHEGIESQIVQQDLNNQNTAAKKLEISGTVSAVSAYVSRGGTNSPENDDAAIQGSLTANYNGFYGTYWVSKLGYSFAEDQAKAAINNNKQLSEAQKAEALSKVNIASPNYYEHDFIVGYTNKYNDLNYDLQLATYVYPGSDNTTGVEAGVFLSHPLSKTLGNSASLSVQSYVNNTVFMNRGDTYVELGYEHPLPQGFKANLSTAVSWYQDSGKYNVKTTEDFVLRHATVQLSHDLFNNPKATGWLKYVVGGENREGISQKNMVVAGMRYAF